MIARTHPAEIATFSAEARAWLAKNMPRRDLQPNPNSEVPAEQARELQRLLFDGGFAGLLYPRAVGGQELTWNHQRAFSREAAPYVMPLACSVTLGILGPTLLDCGTPQQQQRWIPPMLRGEHLWVQLLSEPSNGSDMAAATTRATRDGDVYIVNGAKTWTTGAHFSDFGMALVRTDWEVPKHAGLSMVVIPLHDAQVTIEPIRQADGTAEFCQEFFDDVVVPLDQLVGEENNGWSVATRLLVHERNMVGGNGLDGMYLRPQEAGELADDTVDELVTLARRLSRENDPVTRQMVGEALMLAELPDHVRRRVSIAMDLGLLPSAGSSILKLVRSMVYHRRAQLALEIAGPDALVANAAHPGYQYGQNWIGVRSRSLSGGSNEIQRNIISERVLGLPREHAPDRDIPFNQVQRNRNSGRP
jgi:alkylation response protein AidB-like acyl-CoA dehydrogenase